MARRFSLSAGVERRDLVQDGVAGLLFAARRFDPRLGTPFWAYASFWVRKAMQELVADLSRPVALSDRAVRRLAELRAARNELSQREGREPTMDELATATGLTRAQVHGLLTADRPARSIEASLDPDDDTMGHVAEHLADPDAEQAFDLVLDDIEVRRVHALAESLTDRERTVVNARFGLGESAQTLVEVGSRLGLSAERARQIEAGALGKLRDLLTRPALPAEPP
ncbi:MAG: sigma-70 family RNA polymerase sigma factor [Nocardioides sp.]